MVTKKTIQKKVIQTNNKGNDPVMELQTWKKKNN